MKRPLLIVAISYVIGIIIGVYFKISIPFIVLVSGIFISVCVVMASKNRKAFKIIVIIIVTILISYSRVENINSKYQQIYKFDNKKIKITGTICEQIKETEYSYIVTVRLNGKYKNTKLLVYIGKKENSKKLEYGNQITVTGIYKEPTEKRNYKGCNNKEYLKTKGICGTLEVESKITVVKTKNLNMIQILINKLSYKFKQNLDKLLPKQTAGLAKGILLGDSLEIENSIKENFQECNLSHMLAVSGTHLCYLVLGINLILNKKFFGIRNCKIICIIAIIIFIIIVNMSPSVVRAGISTIIMIISTLIYRKQDTYTTISIALLLTLISNPFSLFNIGLQLSYLATLSIIIFSSKFPQINNKKKKIKTYVLESVALTVSANILILPLLIYNFNKIPLNSVLSNLLAGPILGICIILGLFTLIISIMIFPISKIFAFFLNLLFQLLIKIAEIISKIPFGNYIVITPNIITAILSYVFISACLNNKKKIAKTLIILEALVLISTQVLNFINIDEKLKIYFIDVGQGDSCLMQTPEGKNILIDGGGNLNPEKYDVGEQVLLPYLLDRRIKVLDYIIVSHFDADHAQGLEAVLKTIKVRNIVVSKQASSSAQYDAIIEICKKHKTKVMVAKRGGKIVIDKYVYFEILHPGNTMLDDGKGRT